LGCELRRRAAVEDREEVGQVTGGDGLIEGDPDPRLAERAEVDAPLAAGGEEAGAEGNVVYLDVQGVEVLLVAEAVAEAPEPRGEDPGQAVAAVGDPAQPVRSVVDRVHTRHHREEDLSGADITRRPLPAD